MSSILDALKKLEAEKADPVVQDDLVLDGVSAERELIGDGIMRTGATVRLTPGMLIGLVAVGVVLIAAVAGGTVYWMTGSGAAARVESVAKNEVRPPASPSVATAPVAQPVIAPTPVAQPAPQPTVAPAVATPAVAPAPAVANPQPSAPVAAPPISAPTPTQVASVQPAAPTPQPVAPPAAAPVEASIPGASAPAVQPTATAPAAPAEAAPPAHEKKPARPASGKGDIVAVASVKKPAEPEAQPPMPITNSGGAGSPAAYSGRAATKAAPDTEMDVFSLPVLKESDKARLGMGNLRINMLKPASRNVPYASAVINLRPVYVGERIPNTSATLVAVDPRGKGIALEIEGSGERFHIRF